MGNKPLFKSIFSLLASVLILASCDKDFNEIGADIIGDENFGFELYDGATVNAFNQATEAVQSNNLPVNSLGIYNNPVFGKTKAGFVTQLQMAVPNPSFDMDNFISMDSVVLNVPYFSHKTSDAAVGANYALDSINGSGPINLKVFESGYFLSELDPSTNFEDTQKYYTNQESVFDNNKKGNALNDSPKETENTQFVPNAQQVRIYKRNTDLEFTSTIEKTLAPRMSLHLNKDFFKSKIIDAPSDKLLNNSVFRDYFRGLYFQVADAASGSLMRLDFSKGDITLYYTAYENDTQKKKIIKSFVLNLQGNTVNLISHDDTGTLYKDAIASRTMPPIPNDSKLYVKGGAGGSTAIIDLFGPDLHGADGITGEPNGVADELDIIRNNGWLINEANLTFYVDQEAMKDLPNTVGSDGGKSEHGEPQRVFLFDANNHQPLYDFVTDATKNSDTKLSKIVHSGIIERQNGRGRRYKVRITNHLRNLIKHSDSTNVRLGLVVTESIGLTGNARLEKPKTIQDMPYPFPSKNQRPFDRVPVAAVANPLGTVLYGANIPAGDPDYDKRLRLEIYYTKPKK